MLKRQSNYKTFSLAARRACCMLFALGVPWVFGYFMILAQDQVTKFYFSVIFSGINSLQVSHFEFYQNISAYLFFRGWQFSFFIVFDKNT